ncbi:hypothetical protein ACWATR_00190 [Nostoc sp. UIC 10890]
MSTKQALQVLRRPYTEQVRSLLDVALDRKARYSHRDYTLMVNHRKLISAILVLNLLPESNKVQGDEQYG